jgi:hypothetical protein
MEALPLNVAFMNVNEEVALAYAKKFILSIPQEERLAKLQSEIQTVKNKSKMCQDCSQIILLTMRCQALEEEMNNLLM